MNINFSNVFFVNSCDLKKQKNIVTKQNYNKEKITVPEYLGETALANYMKPKIRLSFKGSVDDNSQELSDEEFNLLVNKNNEILMHLPENIQDIYSHKKSNIKLLNTILSSPEICQNTDYLKKAINLAKYCNNSYECELAKQILFNPENYNDHDIMRSVVKTCDSFELAKIGGEIFSDKNLSFNEKIEQYIKSLCANSSNNNKRDIAKIILSKEEFFQSKGFMKRALQIIRYSNTQETANVSKSFLKNNEITNDETYLGNAIRVLTSCTAPCNENISNAVLSNREFYASNDNIGWATMLIEECDTKEKSEFAAKLIKNPNISTDDKFELWISGLIRSCDTPEKSSKFGLLLDIPYIMEWIRQGDYNVGRIDSLSRMSDYNIRNISELIKEADDLCVKMLDNPYLYINGEYETEEKAVEEINNFIDINYDDLILLTSIFDKKTLNVLLRERISYVKDYMRTLDDFNSEDIKLLSNLASSSGLDGKPLGEKEKIELTDILSAYKDFNLDMTILEEMAKNKSVDIKRLNRNLFYEIQKNCGMTDEEIAQIPEDKLKSWDIKYIHMLTNEFIGDSAFSNLIKAANLFDFNDYIHDTSNKYGKVNFNTRQLFKENGMNYSAWIKPSETNNIHFVINDKNEEQLSQISNQIQEDIETLMQTGAKGFIKKQFPNCIKDDKIIIPVEYKKNKSKLDEFVQNILKRLAPVFKRAEVNLNNPDKQNTAQKTLTVKDHLIQRLEDISEIPDTKSTKSLDLTIKMWDRIPQKDLFQGNYSTCCIGMGRGNGRAMPHYLLNTAFNMIEIKDNKTDKIIGNALCYFIKDENENPAFIIDNIEINNSNKLSDKAGTELRNAMAQYASNVAKEVTKNNDTRIYMSDNYNDVPTDDLLQISENISFLGDLDCNSIYLDLYGDWTNKDKLKNTKRQLLYLFY